MNKPRIEFQMKVVVVKMCFLIDFDTFEVAIMTQYIFLFNVISLVSSYLLEYKIHNVGVFIKKVMFSNLARTPLI